MRVIYFLVRTHINKGDKNPARRPEGGSVEAGGLLASSLPYP